jgi:sarcosine oxidase
MAGCAAAYYLAKMGAPALVFERDRIGNAAASSSRRLGQACSGGAERSYRRTHSDDYHAGLATQSIEGWRAIEKETGAQLLRENGLLFYGQSWEGETYERSIPAAKALMEKRRIPFESLDADAMAKRWPVKPHETYVGLFDKTSGTLWADRALAAFRKGAEAGGAIFREGEEVVGFEAAGVDTVRVRTSKGQSVDGSAIVIAAGAWTNDLLAHGGVHLDLEIGSMLWGHYAVDPQLAERYPQWVLFKKPAPEHEDGGLYYGFPARDGRIKVGVDWCPPAMRTRTMASFARTPDAKRAALLDELLHTEWEGVREKIELFCSPYTMTKDRRFVLDRVPGESRVAVFSGEGGQAFELAPVIGQSLAELALGRKVTADIAPLSINRPAVALSRL